MTQKLARFKGLVGSTREKLARALLLPPVLLLSSRAWAELPEMPVPDEAIGGGSISDGDWLGAMGGWFKAGVTILALILVGLGFIYAVMGALGKWRSYSMGRVEMSDLMEYMILAAVFGVFLVVIAGYALTTLE